MSDYADILNGKLSSGDAANLVEKLQSDLAASRAEVEKLREALQEIRDKKGKVCAEYETCEHPACASSYESWALAHRVLDLTPSPEKLHRIIPQLEAPEAGAEKADREWKRKYDGACKIAEKWGNKAGENRERAEKAEVEAKENWETLIEWKERFDETQAALSESRAREALLRKCVEALMPNEHERDCFCEDHGGLCSCGLDLAKETLSSTAATCREG